MTHQPQEMTPYFEYEVLRLLRRKRFTEELERMSLPHQVDDFLRRTLGKYEAVASAQGPLLAEGTANGPDDYLELLQLNARLLLALLLMRDCPSTSGRAVLESFRGLPAPVIGHSHVWALDAFALLGGTRLQKVIAGSPRHPLLYPGTPTGIQIAREAAPNQRPGERLPYELETWKHDWDELPAQQFYMRAHVPGNGGQRTLNFEFAERWFACNDAPEPPGYRPVKLGPDLDVLHAAADAIGSALRV